LSKVVNRILASDIEKDLDACGMKEDRSLAEGYAYQWGLQQITGRMIYEEYQKNHGVKPTAYRVLDQRTIMLGR